MAITTDLSEPVGQLRLMIGDSEEGAGVKPNGGNFSDDELGFFLRQNAHDLHLAAAAACETLARLWNTQADFSADGFSIKRGSIAAGWMATAARLRSERGAEVVSLKRRDGYSQHIAADEARDTVDGEGFGR